MARHCDVCATKTGRGSFVVTEKRGRGHVQHHVCGHACLEVAAFLLDTRLVRVMRSPTCSPRVQRQKQLQGYYMGSLRGLPPDMRVVAKTIAHIEGVPAAVRFIDARRAS